MELSGVSAWSSFDLGPTTKLVHAETPLSSINPPVYVVERFNIDIALILIAVTGAIGYATGWSLAMLRDKLHK